MDDPVDLKITHLQQRFDEHKRDVEREMKILTRYIDHTAVPRLELERDYPTRDELNERQANANDRTLKLLCAASALASTTTAIASLLTHVF